MRFLGILGLLQSSIALDFIQEYQTRSEITQRFVIRGQNFFIASWDSQVYDLIEINEHFVTLKASKSC